MKKSNRVFIALIVALYIIPFLALGIASLIKKEAFLTGFKQDLRVIRIDNPALRSEDLKIDKRHASEFPRGQLLESTDQSYLYYEGKERYLPEVSRQDSLLMVGLPVNAGQDKDLTLHIRINNIQEIRLNGEIVCTGN